MPRPPLKRRRSLSKSPARRVTASVPSIKAESARTRQQLAKDLAKKPVGKRPADSDDSDNLVTKRTSNFKPSPQREVYASGGVAKGDVPNSHPTRAQRLRKVQNETKQVIRENSIRSVTASRSASPPRSKSPLSKVTTHDRNKANATPPVDVQVRRSRTKSPVNEVLNSQPTLPTEVSVLGSLKPRRRQPSILHMIENNDSSIIHSGDEEQFLPDDESTPHKDGIVSKPAETSVSKSSASRKRKHASDEPVQLQDSGTVLTSSPIVRNSMEPSRSQHDASHHRTKRNRHSNSRLEDEEDIMALPQSSSPESSPRKSKVAAPVRTKPSKPIVPSTADLQTLMPSKRRKGTRSRTPANEFDIPADSTSESVEDDESAFMPQKRGTNARKKDTSAKARKTMSSSSKAGSSVRGKSKQTKSTTPATPRPSSKHALRTPLPLTRSIHAENRTLRSPSTFQTNQNSKQTTGLVKQDVRKGGQSGGFLHDTIRSTRRTRAMEAMNDKENIDINQQKSDRVLSPGSIRNKTKVNSDVDLAGDIDQAAPTVANTDEDVDIEVGRSEDDGALVNVALKTTNGKVVLDEASAWKRKWADIDDFEMEYEEISVSTGSSSPLRR